MIVAMKKVSVVILEKEKKDALEKLRKLGVMHLESLEGESEKLSALKEDFSRAQNAYAILSEIKAPKGARVADLDASGVAEKCKAVVSLSDEKKSLIDAIGADTVELERFAKWGSVDPDDFAYLSEKGIALSMYEMPAALYTALDDSIDTVLVNTGKRDVRFLLIGKERPENLPPEAFEVPLPKIATEKLSEQIEGNIKRIREIETELSAQAVYGRQIDSYAKKLAKEIEFENVYAGMGKENEGKESDLAWLSGYVPSDTFGALEEAAKQNGWAVASGEPEDADDPPTKLKNNALVSLIYPLTDFLGTVPGYREFDISGWFLFFFAIFFGMIFGDAGYGMIMLMLALALTLKSKIAGKKANAMTGLLALLSFSTVVWGTLTCTWFGIAADRLPSWLTSLSVPPISSAYTSRYDGVHSLLTTDQNLQVFCFTLALVQLTVAHIKCFIHDIRSPKCIGDLGSMFMLWGMFYIVLMLVISGKIFSLDKVVWGVPVGSVSLALVGGGFLMSFVFSNYDGSIGRSVLESCKNIISVVLGVVNVFSDIVSYIRLWAVALAGSAISSTVNTMAGPLLGHAIFFVLALVLLATGHGLNVALNVLSVIVHGVRLNTLEFSTHLGMSWSGYKYEPFREAAL